MSSTGITLPSGFIQYVTQEEIVGELNLTFDKENNRYILYNVKILPLTLINSVNFANIHVNSLVGDVTSNPPRFAMAKILARQISALRVAVVSAGGWVKGASDYSFAGLSVGVGTAARTALEQMAASKKMEIESTLLMLTGQTRLEEVDQSSRNIYSRGPGSDFIP